NASVLPAAALRKKPRVPARWASSTSAIDTARRPSREGMRDEWYELSGASAAFRRLQRVCRGAGSKDPAYIGAARQRRSRCRPDLSAFARSASAGPRHSLGGGTQVRHAQNARRAPSWIARAGRALEITPKSAAPSVDPGRLKFARLKRLNASTRTS